MIMYSSYASLEEREGDGKGEREGGGRKESPQNNHGRDERVGREEERQTRTRTKMGEMGIDPTSNADKYTETNTHLQMLHWRCGLSAVNVAITE